MPRIEHALLDCVVYLYRSVRSAKRGTNYGGSGFLVGYLPKGGFHRFPHVYAVTNYHVAVSGVSSVVRLKGLDGKPRVFYFDPSEWEFIPRGDDLAAVRIPFTDEERHKYSVLRSTTFVTPESIWSEQLGVGDDVFMIGRFMDHDGGVTNQPAARFGNISIMPTPIALEDWPERDLYCVDIHSRSGYSGSPVMVYRTLGQDLSASGDTQLQMQHSISGPWIRLKYSNYMGLLGVHVGQFPEPLTGFAKSKPRKGKTSKERKIEIQGLSGMTAVIPAWRITEILELPKLANQRKAIDEASTEQRKRTDQTLPRMESHKRR